CCSCSQNNMIEARARIPLEIADGTRILSAVVYGENAERLIAYTTQQLQAAEDKGADLVAKIRSTICGKRVVCFVRLFQVAGPTYSVVKLYMDGEVASLELHPSSSRANIVELNKPLDANDEGDEVETQLFTPSAKACLKTILDEPTTMSTPKESNSAVSTPKESNSAAVHSLLFENPETTTESWVTTDTHNVPDVHAAYIRTGKKKMSIRSATAMSPALAKLFINTDKNTPAPPIVNPRPEPSGMS
ncbi:ABC transporter, partial [Striga asiatica]